ncbi:MAG: AAA family ATPase [Bacteroidales bacterium]|jgi:exodeoxyribonuclease-5|nr:AAA family ATPase [Bacteroidales bacterium]
MLKEHILGIFLQQIKVNPTENQNIAIDYLMNLILTSDNQQLMLLKGYAGTGKTTVISAFINTLAQFNMKTVLMAPTGRAAKVLSAYSGKEVFTIHKKIYRQKSNTDGWGTYSLNFNPLSDTFFIVDEASMISLFSADHNYFGSGNLLDDLIKFVYSGRNCKLVLIGDTAQLPPVGQQQSPALDVGQLKSYGLQVYEYELTEVMRQAQDSGILYNATLLRQQLSEAGEYGAINCPSLQISHFPDTERVAGDELIETISDAYYRYGMAETMVICRSNKQANRYNQGVRNRILYREEELTSGDLLMVVRNNYFWIQDSEDISFIANGDIAKVQRIRKYIDRYNFRFAEVDLSLPDYHDKEFTAIILLDVLASESASLSDEQNRQLFNAVAEDYAHIPSKKERFKKMKEDPFFNALQVKFAYAVTCHKAQGGQWRCVFLDQGWFKEEMLSVEYLRWLYTAITRSSEKLYLVNFPDNFFK